MCVRTSGTLANASTYSILFFAPNDLLRLHLNLMVWSWTVYVMYSKASFLWLRWTAGLDSLTLARTWGGGGGVVGSHTDSFLAARYILCDRSDFLHSSLFNSFTRGLLTKVIETGKFLWPWLMSYDLVLKIMSRPIWGKCSLLWIFSVDFFSTSVINLVIRDNINTIRQWIKCKC